MGNMKFQLHGFRNRLFIAFAISFGLYFSVGVFQWRSYKAEWSQVVQRHEQVLSALDKLVLCERIRQGLLPKSASDCSQLVFAIQKDEPDYDAAVSAVFGGSRQTYEDIINEYAVRDIQLANEKKQDIETLLKSLANSHLIDFARYELANIERKTKLDYEAAFSATEGRANFSDPGTFSTYVWVHYIKDILGFWVILSAIIFTILTLVKQYIEEPSQGWKRLSLVASIPIAAFSAMYFYNDRIENTIGVLFIAFPLSLLVFLNGKLIHKWVKEGFNFDKGNSDISVIQPPIKTKQAIYEQPIQNRKTITSVQSTIIKPPINQWTEASFWVRLWARGIDISLIILIATLLPELFPSGSIFSSEYTNILIGVALWMILLCFVIIGYEYLFLNWFGATPGKMIFSLKVFDYDNNLIKGSNIYYRTLGLLKSGLGYMFWFPWLQIMLAYTSRKYLYTNGTTKWDLGLYHVKQKPITVYRWFIGVFLAVVLLIFCIGITQFAKQMTKAELKEVVFREFKN